MKNLVEVALNHALLDGRYEFADDHIFIDTPEEKRDSSKLREILQQYGKMLLAISVKQPPEPTYLDQSDWKQKHADAAEASCFQHGLNKLVEETTNIIRANITTAQKEFGYELFTFASRLLQIYWLLVWEIDPKVMRLTDEEVQEEMLKHLLAMKPKLIFEVSSEEDTENAAKEISQTIKLFENTLNEVP